MSFWAASVSVSLKANLSLFHSHFVTLLATQHSSFTSRHGECVELLGCLFLSALGSNSLPLTLTSFPATQQSSLSPQGMVSVLKSWAASVSVCLSNILSPTLNVLSFIFFRHPSPLLPSLFPVFVSILISLFSRLFSFLISFSSKIVAAVPVSLASFGIPSVYLSVSVFLCLFICVCVYFCLCLLVFLYVCLCLCFLCLVICVCVSVCDCFYAYLSVCLSLPHLRTSHHPLLLSTALCFSDSAAVLFYCYSYC